MTAPQHKLAKKLRAIVDELGWSPEEAAELLDSADQLQADYQLVEELREALETEQEEAVRFRDERNVMRDALEIIGRRSTKPWRSGAPWHRQQWAADLVEAALSHPGDPQAARAALDQHAQREGR